MMTKSYLSAGNPWCHLRRQWHQTVRKAALRVACGFSAGCRGPGRGCCSAAWRAVQSGLN